MNAIGDTTPSPNSLKNNHTVCLLGQKPLQPPLFYRFPISG